MTDPTILAATIYADEAQLLSWSETDKGRKVTLMLSPHFGEQHPFREYKPGKRFMLAATVIGDDEQPERAKAPAVKQTPAEPAQQPSNTPFKRSFRDMPRSQQAALKLQDDEFCKWLMSAHGIIPIDVPPTPSNWMNEILGITTKKELDLPGHHSQRRWDALLTDFDTRHMVRK